jgi:hypothetical protein
MAQHVRPTVAQSRAVLGLLRLAQQDLAVFLDPQNPDCSVPEKSRGGLAGLYLSSWVQGPLEAAVRRLECALEGTVHPYDYPVPVIVGGTGGESVSLERGTGEVCDAVIVEEDG